MASFLDTTLQTITSVQNQINSAKCRLSQSILDAKQELTTLYSEKRALEEEARRALGEVAPIRRVPAELLRAVFLDIFEEDATGKAGWIFAAVCRRWRIVSLETPMLWTRIRLVTKLDDSADVIRLWMERAGHSMPLDIEIYLRVPQIKAAIPAECGSSVLPPIAANRRPRRRTGALMDDGGYSPPVGNGSESWGHVAVFYLKQQMPRWKRFVFRYDRVFSSLAAFKGISGNAPKLQEFEISSIEPSMINFTDWTWMPNITNITLPALQRVSTTNIPLLLNSSLLSQPLHTIYISALSTSPIQVGSLMQMLAKHASTLCVLSLNLPSMTPPVVPATTLPFTSNTPLCFPLLEELSLGGHNLMSQLAGAITTPSLEELNVDIDLGRGGISHTMAPNGAANGVQHFSYIEEVVHALLHRGSPAPADKLKALSIAFGFGNGRRATKERDSDPYLQALKFAQACPCAGTTFLPPGHYATPTPSVVHISWQFLASLPALQSLKVGLGGHAGPVWPSNVNTSVNNIPYTGGSVDIEHFLSSLCVPDEDYMTGSATLGIHGPIPGPPAGNNVVTFTVGFNHQPTLNNHNNAAALNAIFAGGIPPPPPIHINQQFNPGNLGLPPLPPPPGGPAYIPPHHMIIPMGGGPGPNPAQIPTNGWLLPNLTELGVKAGSTIFSPATTGGINALFSSSSSAHSYGVMYPPIMPSYNSWSSLDDSSNIPGAGYVRRLLELIEGRNPKTGQGQNIDGVVPERLKSLEIVLNVAGIPARGVGHANGLFTKNGNKGVPKKKAAKDKESEMPSTAALENSEGSVQEIVAAISASASGLSNVPAKEKVLKSRNTNAATARTLIGSDSATWIEERIEEVSVRCECMLGESGGMGMPRMW
ncbi:uncharacterized protein C8R40DRAFT_846837 [Lentinula edodes]|uniref:uncharacterized protein n=1 Tax=Lentinula edodes TaxID=5353 RepID=UPI001E8D5EE5|nr:uncharacterized protein C8R40DRAFT_846837 [Lentinula edodes]KAH7868332.1 hypothetical protein C8R40DRAFT_846837 [Lentinula edodes]